MQEKRGEHTEHTEPTEVAILVKKRKENEKKTFFSFILNHTTVKNTDRWIFASSNRHIIMLKVIPH